MPDYKNLLNAFQDVVVPKMFGIKSVGLLSSYGFSMGSLLIPTDYLLLIFVLSMFYILRKCKNTNELVREFKSTNKMAIYASLLFVLSLFGLNRVTEFIYFNF